MKKLLVVDDDYSMRSVLQEALKNHGYVVDVAKQGEEAMTLMGSTRYNLVITDLMMPKKNGMELLTEVRDNFPSTGILIITAYGTIEMAVEAMRKGAFDFITKPFSIAHIESRVKRFFDFDSLKKENESLRRELSFEKRFKKLVGQSKDMHNIFNLIDVVAKSDASVFIQGESGTGKELVAQAIHENSERATRPFLKVNCSAIPETLFESTLFGHEKGSFTNAYKTHAGFFEEAAGGTLLLDEISEIPLSMQAKLLRALQEGKISRVGSTVEKEVDVRIIATSNRSISKLIEDDKFRADLFYRINVFPITISPLRNRREDIPVLLDHFLRIYRSKYSQKDKVIPEDTIRILMNYNWPGNVRELENTLERAILFSGEKETLSNDYFSLDMNQMKPDQEFDFDGSPCTLAEWEKRLIYATLKRTNGNRTHAARILGISVRTLRNKLHLYEAESKTAPAEVN